MTQNYFLLRHTPIWLAVLLPYFSTAQWTISPLGGNESVTALFSTGNAWVANSAGGIYRSLDDGLHWTKSFQMYEYGTILHQDGNDFYAVDQDNGLKYSNDGAEHWTHLSSDMPTGIGSPKSLQTTDRYIFIQNYNTLYRYDKTQPATGEKVLENNPGYYPNTLNHQASGARVWVAAKDSLLYSTDEGSSWTLMSEGLRIKELFQHGDTLMAIVDAGVYRSTNNGATWDPVLFGQSASGLFWDAGQWFVNIYISNKTHLKASSNGGADWSDFNASLNNQWVYRVIRKGGLALAASSYGVFRSQAPYDVWEGSGTGLPFDNSSVWGATLAKVGNYLVCNNQFSEDEGRTWFRAIIGGELSYGQPIHHQGSYYILTYDRRLYRSDSDLRHWQFTGSQFSTANSQQYLVSSGDRLFILEYSTSISTVLESTDAGLTWTPTGGTVQGGFLTGHNGYLFEWRNNSGLYRSADGGVHWQSVGAGLGNMEFDTPQAFSEGGNLYILSYYGDLKMSSNNGLTFSNLSEKLKGSTGFSLGVSAVATDSNYIAVITYEGIYLRTKSNDQWYNITGNLPNTGFFDGHLAIINGEVFMDNGYYLDPLWRRSLSSIHLAQLDGQVYKDDNNNGQQDAGETPYAGAILQAGANYFATTDADGKYRLFAETSNDTLRVKKPSPWVQSNPDHYLMTGSGTGVDFGLYFPPDVTDLRVELTNETVFRPGFPERVYLNYFNQGTVNADAQIRFVTDDKVEFISAYPAPDAQHGDTLVWNILAMNPLSEKIIQISVKTRVDVPIGSTVRLWADISPDAADANPADNTNILQQTVVGSYDPNDKQCSVPSVSPEQIEAGKALQYTIRFQNTGTYPAAFVRIADTLDVERLDVSSFRVLATSHPCRTTLSGSGQVEFYFDPINLPPSGWNEPASHGFVKYSITPKKGLALGQDIRNTAFIYFDFNPAIVTNTTHTGVALQVGTRDLASAQEIQVFPNPAGLYLNINLNGPSEEGLLRITNSLGQVAMEQSLETGSHVLDVSRLAPGAYFLEWRSASGALHAGNFIKW